VIGATYLERGRPVVVLVRWAGSGPRNVLVERANGVRVVRPFRGLRKPTKATLGGKP
jgi:acetyl esterase